MGKTLDLRTYLLLERAFARRLQRSWEKLSAPTYAAITQACLDHNWAKARVLVTDLDMTEVGTQNREWITYMLLSCATFGAGTVAKNKPSFVGVGTFDTFLKQTTNNIIQYLEFNATAQVQEEALQLIATDEARAKLKVAYDPSQPRDAQGQWTSRMMVMSEDLLRVAQQDTARASGLHMSRIENDVQGVVVGAVRAFDSAVHRGEFTLEEVAKGWEDTRAALREQYGDTVVLHRHESGVENPNTLTVYMGDKALAEKFGSPTAYEVPVDDVVAVYARPSGYYEFIVKKPKPVQKYDPNQPRDKQGQWTTGGSRAGFTPEERAKVRGEYPIEGGWGPARAEWEKRNKAVMDADEVLFDARDVYHPLRQSMVQKYGDTWLWPTKEWGDPTADSEYPAYLAAKEKFHAAQKLQIEAQAALDRQEPAMKKEVVRNLVGMVAERMGVDPTIVDVVDKDPPEFEVGNQKFTEAGHYDPTTRRIEINVRNLSYGDAPAVKGLVAHEMSHAIYHTAKRKAEAEFQRYLNLAVTPDGSRHTDWYHERFAMTTVGVRRSMELKPEYVEEFSRDFPASAALATLSGGKFFQGISQEMVQENGHSEYAKSYWEKEAVAARGHTYESAINETIAEVTRYLVSPSSWHAPDHPPHPTSPWVKLTTAMHEWYGEAQEDAKIAAMKSRT